jgi:hypothetical protein
MSLAVAVWLIILAVLVAGFLIVFRRMSLLIGRTRDLERFQRDVAALDGRLGTVVGPLEARLAEIRRHAGDPPALRAELEPAQTALRALATDVEELHAPNGLGAQAAALGHEIDRAQRAAEMLEHGLDTMLAVRGGRELEAQTILKRADLGLRLAREGSSTVTARIAAVTPADLVSRAGRGGRGKGPGGVDRTTYVVPEWDSDEDA